MKRNYFFGIIMIFIITLGFVGCGNTHNTIYNTEKELQNYLIENELDMNYPQFKFSITDLKIDEYDETYYYLKAISSKYDLDSAEKLVKEARNTGIQIVVTMGQLETMEIHYSYWSDGKFHWNVLDIDGKVNAIFDDITDVNKEDLEEYLLKNQNNLLGEFGATSLLVNAYDYIEGVKEDFPDAELFVKYYQEIMEIGIHEGVNNKFWYAPIDLIEENDTKTFVYENGKTLIINSTNWTTNIGIVDNSIIDENLSVSDNDIYLAVINIYNSLSNYMNGNESIVFDTESLKMIVENYDKIQEFGLFESPINIEEYDTMRSGPTVRFDYDAGVSIIWTKNTNEVVIAYDEY